MNARLPLVYNPRSGRGAKDVAGLLAQLPEALRRRLEPVRLEPPFDFRPAVDQARAAGGPLLVWGGDGTLNHAARALVELGCPVALGAVPGGSGNGLVRGLRTPLEPAGAVERLLQGRELAIDLARLDGTPFLNVCGTGFEGEVAAAFARAPGRGFSSYAAACLRQWRRRDRVAVRWDEAEACGALPAGRMDRLRDAWRGPQPALPESAWSLCFANLPQYGSGLWIAPGADPADGALDWVQLRWPGMLGVVLQVPQLFREDAWCSLRTEGRVRRAVLRLDRAWPWHLDGEPVAARDRAELTVEPGAFRMQVTGDCPWG